MGNLKVTVTLCILLAAAAAVVCCKAPSLFLEPAGEGSRPEQASRFPIPDGGQAAFLLPSAPIKQATVQRLLAHEINLLQAARLFRFANERPHATLEEVPAALPVRPDDPHHAHEVIAWVVRERALSHDSGRDALLSGLHRELHALLHGPAPLPLPWSDPEYTPPARTESIGANREEAVP
jgi:hypothetical protein